MTEAGKITDMLEGHISNNRKTDWLGPIKISASVKLQGLYGIHNNPFK